MLRKDNGPGPDGLACPCRRREREREKRAHTADHVRGDETGDSCWYVRYGEAFGIGAGPVVSMNRNTPGYCARGSLFLISSRIIDREGKQQEREFPSVSGQRDQWLHGAGGDPMNRKDRGD